MGSDQSPSTWEASSVSNKFVFPPQGRVGPSSTVYRCQVQTLFPAPPRSHLLVGQM